MRPVRSAHAWLKPKIALALLGLAPESLRDRRPNHQPRRVEGAMAAARAQLARGTGIR